MKTIESKYDEILELFENAEPSQAWVDAFNEVALSLECRDELDGSALEEGEMVATPGEGDAAFKTDDDAGAPTTAHQLPWKAWLDGKMLYMASPPIVFESGMFRLVLDVMNPHRGRDDSHMNVHCILCNQEGKMLSIPNNSNTACLLVSPDAGPAMIFSCWDFVAREGVDKALESGIITNSWVNVVSVKIPCKDIPPVHEAHAMRMLEVYARENDLDMAITMYRLVAKGRSHSCRTMANDYNKIGFYLNVINAEPIDGMFVGMAFDMELNGVRHKIANSRPGDLKRWLLNGKGLDGKYFQSIVTRAEKEIYPNSSEMTAARDLRSGCVSVINSFPPGLGISPRIVPEEYARSVPIPLKGFYIGHGDNFADAMKRAINRLGRKNIKDVDGLFMLEMHAKRTCGKGFRTIHCYDALIVEPSSGRHVEVSYNIIRYHNVKTFD